MKTTHTPGPWEVSKHGTPDYAPQFGVYAVGASNEHAIVKGPYAAADAALIEAAPDMLGLLRDIASIIDTTDSEHPAFMDSGADSIALLWELNGRLRATIRQANGGAA